MATFEQLPAESQSALQDYRDWAQARNPKRDWKRCLMNDWARAGSDWPQARDRYGYLHILRNTYGSEWLDKLVMPE